MRKFVKITNREVGSSELIFADGHVDALSYYRKKNDVAKSVVLEASDVYAYDFDKRYHVTKLSEIPDGAVFRKVITRTSEINAEWLIKKRTFANGMVECWVADDIETPAKYFKQSTKIVWR